VNVPLGVFFSVPAMSACTCAKASALEGFGVEPDMVLSCSFLRAHTPVGDCTEPGWLRAAGAFVSLIRLIPDTTRFANVEPGNRMVRVDFRKS
jgi:hypothetical protein